MLSNMLLREARLRSGLTQEELGRRVGVPANVISRWELGKVALGFDRLAEMVRACDLELSVALRPADDERLSLATGYLGLTPRRRLEQLVGDVRQNAELFGEEAPGFDPLSILRALRRAELDFIVVGDVAATLHGSPFPTYGLDITPQPGGESEAALVRALEFLGVSGREEGNAGIVRHRTGKGLLYIVPRPAGTAGYGDLARSAEQMDVGFKVRVASLADIIRSADALARADRRGQVMTLRRLATELLDAA